jgi:signal transduction histidine kinase
VESIGGHFQIETGPSRGTRVSAQLPLHNNGDGSAA